MTTGNFSDKTWSGTPMWQIADELEQTRKKREEEERRKASTPVAVLNVKAEGDHFLAELTLLIPSGVTGGRIDAKVDASNSGFREVKVRGPKRKSRREAIKDGFEMRQGFHQEGEAEVHRRRRELSNKTWNLAELPTENARIDQPQDKEQRLRLAQRPRGTGWSRQKDAEFFVHTHSPMAYDPKKMQYYSVEPTTQSYVPCDPPHDPVEYPATVSAGASLVGRADADINLPERPRTVLLKELVPTGRAMKKPLFFLDQPASCFALFEGVRGSAAVDHCSKNFHTKLLSKLSSTLQYWSDALTRNLIESIFEELESELLPQQGTCYDGASVAVAIYLGDRLTVATLGAVRGLLISPSGQIRTLGDQHSVRDEGPERQRMDAAGGEFTSVQQAGANVMAVRRPCKPRNTVMAQDQVAEITRVLDEAPDSFAALGFGADDVIDAKVAKANYRKLALKVHPDKAPEDLKEKAKAAFAKVESALARVEALLDADIQATAELQKIFESAGSVTDSVMPRSWARCVLRVEESASLDEVEQSADELKKTLSRLGLFADGRLALPDAVLASQLLDEAVEVLQAPPPKDGAKLEAVGMSRALGLRDLKKPRPIVTAEPRLEVIQMEAPGSYHLALLSSSTSILADSDIVSRMRSFPRQPKTASLVIAQDASELLRKCSSASAPTCLASAVVGCFEVQEEKVEEPVAKKARNDAKADKVKCLHILLKHKDLRMSKDMESLQRLKGKPAITRTLTQAERELLDMQRQLVANPNIFHILARKHSECDSALQPGQNAGDLGWVSRGTCGNPQFEAVMFSLKPYEVSDIVTTPRGLHIIQRIA